ncbi:Glycosaminoglycan polysaccharide lyase [Giardia duodenalis]|uniref:Glycosaminoglycan polysaccharide lyase n=1 Tax=Giardia intestinalis (strain ATCC 50803 / WB clone C6) TaxID=184922 RepID=A8BDS4_GIAIC|nr:Glycosaminoglycan polysaccharide lyase [Giardia intestinalis]KAE8305899.1 Glycosaminoglycan polysaccharide lyase [Giardia intestinalis]|eukprot:XP_001707514.1 Hypothetical protein GL50803_90236 [Giardia lamblia ATCC 50803]
MLILLLLTLCYTLFPFPTISPPISVANRYSQMLQTIGPFQIVRDQTMYKSESLNKYKTAFSSEAKQYYDTFDGGRYGWDDLNDPTKASTLQNILYRLIVMATAYLTDGMELYHNEDCKIKILQAFTIFSGKYNPALYYSNDHHTWDIIIPNTLVNLLPLLDEIYSNDPSLSVGYQNALTRVTEALLTLPKRSPFINQCTNLPSTWYRDTECTLSSIVMELQMAKLTIFGSILIGDLSRMNVYYNRIIDLFQVRHWNYELAPTDDLHDGFRSDGTFVEYFSSIIPGSTGYSMLSLIASILAPSQKIIEQLTASGNTDAAQSIQTAVHSIAGKAATYILDSILPFVVNCGVPDMMAGADAANDSKPPLSRLKDISMGIMQFAYAASLQNSLPSNLNELLGHVFKYLNYHLTDCPQIIDEMTGHYNFPIIGEWNRSTGLFLSVPTYPGEIMYGHYFLSYGDRYVYNAHDFSVNIAMNSYKTRNFQCIRNLNKLGFYQAAGAIMPSVRYHKDQYNHHVLFASEKGYMGTTAYPKFSSKCSSQTHLFGSLSDGKFVSSITDGEHGSASMDYYNAPENDVRYRALYLIESISQGVHVAQMTTGGARLGDLTANVAVVPYVDGDTFEIYLDGAKKTQDTISFSKASRILIKMTPKSGSQYAVALFLRKNLSGTIKNVTINKPYTDLGGSSSTKIKTYGIHISLTLKLTSFYYTDKIYWNARKAIFYSYYPYLPYSTNDQDLATMEQKYRLLFKKGRVDENASVHSNKYMLVSFSNSTQDIIAISFFEKGSATLASGITIAANDTVQILFKVTDNTYYLIMRDPVISSPRPIRVEVQGLIDMHNLQHWCHNAGVVDSTTLVIEESFLGPSLCQVRVDRQVSQTPDDKPIPPTNPPSPTPPPYIPPFLPTDDLLYDNSTDVIVIPDNQAMRTAKIAAISASIIIVLVIIVVLLVVFLLRCKKTAKDLKAVEGALKMTPIPPSGREPPHAFSVLDNDSTVLESIHSVHSTFSEASAINTTDPDPKEAPQPRRVKVQRSLPSKFGSKKTTAVTNYIDEDGVDNDSFDSISIHHAAKMFTQ